MKNGLCALVVAATILFAPSAFSSTSPSAINSSSGELSKNTSSPSELPGDTIIHFPDPKFEARVRELINKPTGDILVGDVSEITYIGVSGLDISDLTGIEYFSSLQKLDCFSNLLTQLDVSHNTKLIWLDCYDNQLTSLELGDNDVLKTLVCGDNYLTFLSLDGATALEFVRCSGNQLTMIDISKNTALLTFACDWNQLTTLDISKNTELTHLLCNENNFSDKSAIVGLDESRLEFFAFEMVDYIQ